MIYLDNAATTFPKPEQVYAAVDEAQRQYAVNAGRGSYRTARKANDIIRETRNLIADLVRCPDSKNVVLSPSATIALNQIIHGLTYSSNTVVYVSPYEHNAVVRTLYRISEIYGFSIRQLPVLSDTFEIDIDDMKNRFAVVHPDYVFVNHVSNVTGYILPYKAIFSESKKYNAVNILDTAQSLGVINIAIDSDIDFLAFAGHKNLYSNIGIGGFVYNSKTELKPFITGGTGSNSLDPEMPCELPDKYEAASPDIVAIASLNASLKWLRSVGVDEVYRHKKELTEYTVKRLNEIERIKLLIPTQAENHISVISFLHEDYTPNEIAEILDMDFDIAVRSGFHCAPYVHNVISTEETLGTVRIGLGYFNTKDDIDRLTEALIELE